VPSYAEVLRTPAYLQVFLAATFSTWGDYIARVAAAAIVFSWTGSAVATAATFAVSLIPTILGRGLLGPLCDRFPAKATMVVTHFVRAVIVGLLILTVATTRSVALVLVLVFLLEFVGGPAITASQMILTEVFAHDRRLYAKGLGLGILAGQINQAIGLAVGGVIVSSLGHLPTLALDAAAFVIGALLLMTVRLRPVPPVASSNFFRDLAGGWRQIQGDRVLTRLLLLSLTATLAISAPEAVALPYADAATHNESSSWGGLLMAAPILGTVLGLVLIGRLPAERQSANIMRLALLMPLPLLVTIFQPPLWVVWLAWFACGALQAFMLPLQAAFTLLVPTALRGRVFGLAGAVSVGVSGVSFLLAGWISEHTSPAASVGICAVVTLGILILLAARWPKDEVAGSIEATFAEPEIRSETENQTQTQAQTQPGTEPNPQPQPQTRASVPPVNRERTSGG
jgi:MFS family permease